MATYVVVTVKTSFVIVEEVPVSVCLCTICRVPAFASCPRNPSPHPPPPYIESESSSTKELESLSGVNECQIKSFRISDPDPRNTFT